MFYKYELFLLAHTQPNPIKKVFVWSKRFVKKTHSIVFARLYFTSVLMLI